MFAIIDAIENNLEHEFITQIYLKYYKKMRAKAFFIVHDELEADEIVQESFIKLIEHVKELMMFDPIKVPAYVMVTVKNVSLHHWHNIKNEQEYKAPVSDDEFDRLLADEKGIPEEIYIHEEELQALADTLKKLPEKDRLVLESKYILSLSDKEIAEQLNISTPSVRSYLTRARRKAYAIMKEDYPMAETIGISKQNIQESYEDFIFRKVMAIYAANENKRILSEIKS